ncbi:hypothetical protein [Oculatella sp. FACHB-28]|uniref:hypothetical protein n=1 Tax=Oculatella sp. FACHB-28 TaxID=2692845 RepID=UPI001683908A|nr:hypothetical protein [Oculatella sp. FACHB-28]
MDTNILSEPLRPQPNPLVIQRLVDHSEVYQRHQWSVMKFNLAVIVCPLPGNAAPLKLIYETK